ncbi:MAG: hypothetical protein Q9P01_19225 [Anaerolineae bacterium]|nr:hypothetical protein [Anaerolineae bacterium]
MAQDYSFTLPKVYQYNSVDDIISNTGGHYDNFEGWVAEFSDGQRVKFKTDRYVEIHRHIRKLNFPNVLQAVRNNDIDYLTTLIPDDFLEEVYEWIIEIQETVQHINTQTVRAFVQAPRTNGDIFRQWVNENQPELALYLLAMWEGRDIESLIYRHAFTDKLTRS